MSELIDEIQNSIALNLVFPERRGCQLQDDLREDEEGESWPALDDVLDLDALLVRHEAEDGEDDDGGVERGERVHGAHHEGVPAREGRSLIHHKSDFTQPFPNTCITTTG